MDGMKFTRYYVYSVVGAPSRYNALSGRCASWSLKQKKEFPYGVPVKIGWEAGVIREPHPSCSISEKPLTLTNSMCDAASPRRGTL